MTHVHPALRDTDWLKGIPSHVTLLDRASLVGITASLTARPSLWRPLVRHDPDQRWYELLLRSDALEVWLIGWTPGQETAAHDHGGAAGALTVTAGALVEEVFDRWGVVVARHQLGSATSTGFEPEHVHRIGNRGAVDATSIHAYSPPSRPVRRYTHSSGGWSLEPEVVRS